MWLKYIVRINKDILRIYVYIKEKIFNGIYYYY